MYTLGLLGAGNMGEALLKGILKKEVLAPSHIYVADAYAPRLEDIAARYGVHMAKSNVALVESCDIILLAVKPDICKGVVSQCAKALSGKAVVSIVTGWTKAEYTALAPGVRCLCVIPNTPCMVGEGMCALNNDHSLQTEEYAFAKRMLEAVGSTVEVPPTLMAAITGVSGSGPAYAYIFIEALADAGVREGLARPVAYQLAAQTLAGAGKMVLETGMHPGALKDAVCSPGGTTIEAVAALEKTGFRAAVMEAVAVCTDKARLLAKK